ncbi:MAG: hypothetical protein IPI91_18125 [Flavobacteriales bacterium]|nr:hypothetical protein [Flavobacteriales bacterium]
MIKRSLVAVVLSATSILHLSAQDIVVQSIIDALQIDSIIHYVEEIGGETPIDIGNGPELISESEQIQSR